ncbi:MAG: polysaccharide deacetylase family protein, partial [Pseudonocardia sp.]|nr:polysaccharide deacetylase family protein [Pseudonocardia sp.]
GGREAAAVSAAGYAYGCAVGTGGTGVAPGPFAMPRSYAGQRDASARLLAKRVRHVGRKVWAR